jgi:hypothetical protein
MRPFILIYATGQALWLHDLTSVVESRGPNVIRLRCHALLWLQDLTSVVESERSKFMMACAWWLEHLTSVVESEKSKIMVGHSMATLPSVVELGS